MVKEYLEKMKESYINRRIELLKELTTLENLYKKNIKPEKLLKGKEQFDVTPVKNEGMTEPVSPAATITKKDGTGRDGVSKPESHDVIKSIATLDMLEKKDETDKPKED